MLEHRDPHGADRGRKPESVGVCCVNTMLARLIAWQEAVNLLREQRALSYTGPELLPSYRAAPWRGHHEREPAQGASRGARRAPS